MTSSRQFHRIILRKLPLVNFVVNLRHGKAQPQAYSKTEINKSYKIIMRTKRKAKLSNNGIEPKRKINFSSKSLMKAGKLISC